MPLSLQSRRVGDIIVVTCSGRIVEGAESAALQRHVYDLLPDDPFITLDLSQVDFIDSAGLGLLVRLLSRARTARGDLKPCAVPARISEVLRITRLGSVFDVHESEADAIAAFYQRATSADAPDRLDTEILCVEKSADVLAYVCGVLRQAGYGVMPSGNLPDALVLLTASRPKVVVVGADLRAARGTRAADHFNELADALPVVELPADFSCSDPGDAGHRLLDRVRAVIGTRETGAPDRRTTADLRRDGV